MSDFRTPLKDKSNHPQGQPQGSAPTRQGDWQCLHCNNLNFSFRKKCNRCKLQTREENERLSAYYYHCSHHYYYPPHKGNIPSFESFSPPPQALVPLPSSSRELFLALTPSKAHPQEELPSVSPLVKRYKQRYSASTQ
jgi:hypothetical protein